MTRESIEAHLPPCAKLRLDTTLQRGKAFFRFAEYGGNVWLFYKPNMNASWSALRKATREDVVTFRGSREVTV